MQFSLNVSCWCACFCCLFLIFFLRFNKKTFLVNYWAKSTTSRRMRVGAPFLLVLLAAAGITVHADGKNLTGRKGARCGSGACEGWTGGSSTTSLPCRCFNFQTTDRCKDSCVSLRSIQHVRFSRGCSVCRMMCPRKLLGIRLETTCVGRAAI